VSVESLDPSALLAPALLWTELPPGLHVAQFCEDDATVLDTLEAYTAGGLMLGEAVIVIATAAHLGELRQRLRLRGMDLATLQIFDQLICVDADEALRRFMRGGSADTAIFEAMVGELLARGRSGGRTVRAYGEMVQLLWAEGNHRATLQLESLWERICDLEGVPLLCAYRKETFSDGDREGIRHICAAHTSVIS
jgi:hypothetical protein